VSEDGLTASGYLDTPEAVAGMSRYQRLFQRKLSPTTAVPRQFEDGKAAGTMRPAKWFFNKRESEPTTETAIRRRISEDLYIVLAGYEAGPQQAVYTITVNPLVNWIWLGFGILAIGTGIAMMPERAYVFAAAKLPAGSATTTLLLILMLLPARAARADGAERSSGAA
jgi:hypothetical protein